jgi:hypothetical protein
MLSSFENNLPRRLVLRFVLVGANEQAQVGGSRLVTSERTRDRDGLLTVALLREMSGDTEAVFGGKGF